MDMQVFELLEKLKRVNEKNWVWMRYKRRKYPVRANVDDIGDVDMYAVGKGEMTLTVKNLIKLLKEIEPYKEAFLGGVEEFSYCFTGIKYDKDANVVLYIKSGDIPA